MWENWQPRPAEISIYTEWSLRPPRHQSKNQSVPQVYRDGVGLVGAAELLRLVTQGQLLSEWLCLPLSSFCPLYRKSTKYIKKENLNVKFHNPDTQVWTKIKRSVGPNTWSQMCFCRNQHLTLTWTALHYKESGIMTRVDLSFILNDELVQRIETSPTVWYLWPNSRRESSAAPANLPSLGVKGSWFHCVPNCNHIVCYFWLAESWLLVTRRKIMFSIFSL